MIEKLSSYKKWGTDNAKKQSQRPLESICEHQLFKIHYIKTYLARCSVILKFSLILVLLYSTAISIVCSSGSQLRNVASRP